MTEIQKNGGRNECRNECRNGWNDLKDKAGNNDRYNAEMMRGMISGLENLPEVEDCSSAVLPDTSEPGEGQKKVVISDPVSMGKYLFDNYRVDLYTYLNKLLWNGTLSRIVGCRVLNRVLNSEAVDFPGVSFWRIDRENFYSDVSVELKLKTTVGSLTWNGVIEIWCSFEGDFTLSFESLGRSVDREGFDRLSTFLVPYFTNRRVDEVAEQLWLRYIPEALNDPGARKAEKLAERMGLKVLHRDIYEHRGVKGIIFFAEDELLVGEDRYETDEDGNRILVKTEHPVTRRIDTDLSRTGLYGKWSDRTCLSTCCDCGKEHRAQFHPSITCQYSRVYETGSRR